MHASHIARPSLLGVRGLGSPVGAVGNGAKPDGRGAGELDLIVRDLARRMGAETGLLTVVDGTEGIVEVLAARGGVPSHDGLPLSAVDGFVGRVLKFGRAAVEPLDPNHDDSLGAPLSGRLLTYAAGAAVRAPGGPPGALCVGFSRRPAHDLTHTLWLVESYARLASLCLLDAGALGGLLESARRDGLTGCLNYSATRRELGREIRRSNRHGLSVSCCFIDLDRFKGVNTQYGHLQGSRVLAAVGAGLCDEVRSDDTVGRYGGDEFVALLPETGERAAMQLAERLRARIATTELFDGEPDRIDASIGVAQWRPGCSVEVTLAEADDALRAAKAAGGGKVVSATDLQRHSGLAISGARTRVIEGARAEVHFCANCGQPPEGASNGGVCAECGVGRLISAPADTAPAFAEPFLIVDADMTVRAVSKRAESLLGVRERTLIDRRIGDVLIPADAKHTTAEKLELTLAECARGEGPAHQFAVNATTDPNVHFSARVGPCGPPRSALVVLSEPTYRDSPLRPRAV
jgi:diguanylate cyclase (GGDEF)-like protein